MNRNIITIIFTLLPAMLLAQEANNPASEPQIVLEIPSSPLGWVVALVFFVVIIVLIAVYCRIEIKFKT